jgi:uncharacterized membrane protein YvbJ
MSNDTPIEDRVDEAIHDLLNYMKNEKQYSDNYKSMFTQLTKVMELRQQDSSNQVANAIKMEELAQKDKDVITKEAWLTVGTHIAGLIVLMNHERAHVIASKAFGLVKKIF